MRKGLLLGMAAVVASTFALTTQAVAEGGQDYPGGYWDVVGNDRIPLIQQMIEEKGMCWTAGPTSMSDLTDEEKQQRLGYRPITEEFVEPDPNPPTLPEKGLPDVFDWRTQLKCTYAENQGGCGSCWLHSPIAALESAILIYEDQRFDLSEQHILSCVSYGWGCNGGQPTYALNKLVNYGAILEECMPYQANHTVPCTEGNCEVVTTLDAYYSVTTAVTDIKNAVYNYGPVSSDMWVFDDFNYYSEGCYDAGPMHSANHCVLICGWDDTECGGEGAWICKNSWGVNWGIDGFFYIKYGVAGIGRGVKRLEYTPKMHLLRPGGYAVDSGGKGNGNGFLEPGETAQLVVTVANDGKGPATGVVGTLRTSAAGVTVLDSVADFQNMNAETAGSTLAPHFEISIDGGFVAGNWIDFELDLVTDTRAAVVHFPVYVGTFVEVLTDDFETNQGWTVGAPDDDATEGIWERAEPTEKLMSKYTGDTVQPGKDATVHPGTMCFVTEDSPLGTAQRFGDVDGGKTTLLSPVLDLSSYDTATLSYRRYYSNNTISTQTDDDPFYVDVSGDGGATWVNLETLTETPEDRGYHQMVFDLGSAVPLREQMQIRFVATDYGLNSVVEAVVDDIEVRGFGALTATAGGEGSLVPVRPRTLVLEQNIPNPFNPETAISFGLPRGGEVDLGIYNIRGQRVRQLVEGWMPAGFHTEMWDGRDGHGQPVSSGVYFYRLSTSEGDLTRRMTLIK